MQKKLQLRAICLGLAACAGLSAEAAVVGCNTDATTSVLAVNNELGAYCVSDYGWSNTWYSTSNNHPIPSVYDQELDLFSGDDAVNLSFSILDESGPIPVTGNGWLTPTLDAGALFPFYNTNSNWSVRSPVQYTTPGDETKTQSVIRLTLPGNLGVIDSVIDTIMMPDGAVRQFYTLINNSDALLTDITFADYFNFHPNGSLIAATQEGFTSIDNGTATVIGNRALPNYIGNGFMHLIDENGNHVTPTRQDIGCADVLGFDPNCALTGGAAIPRVETRTYNGLAGPIGPGDLAATLAFDSPAVLGDGESITFGLEKRVVPEPAALLLVGVGMIALALGRLSGSLKRV